MHGRSFVLSLMLCSGCGAGDAASAAEHSGRLVLERAGERRLTLLDEPAIARYCERDSLLSIVAVSRRWSVAIALRTAWPADTTTPYTVELLPGAPGTAALAARALADSVRPALQSSAGTVTALTSAPLAGRFDVRAGSDTARMRLVGHFDALRVMRTACPE